MRATASFLFTMRHQMVRSMSHGALHTTRHTDDKPEDWCCGGEEWAMFHILTSSIYYVTKSAKTESFANTFGQESQCQ